MTRSTFEFDIQRPNGRGTVSRTFTTAAADYWDTYSAALSRARAYGIVKDVRVVETETR